MDEIFEPTCSMDKFGKDFIKFLNDFSKYTDDINFDFNKFIHEYNSDFYLAILR